MAGRTTNKDKMADLLRGGRPRNGERLVQYNIFLTDAFDDHSGSVQFMVDPGVPRQIDGWDNDDSYRQSRHFANRANAAEIPEVNRNLRENSLARQLQAKKDQPATIRLIRRRLESEFMADPVIERRKPWQNLIPPNTKFFLEQVQENREEKVQVIDTFGEWVAFFFGQRPEVYNYSGTLLNTTNHDWKNEFQENYDNFLRGTKAVASRATMLLQYDDVVVEGYMMNCAISQSATNNNSTPFTFSLLVISRSPVNAMLIHHLRFKRSGGTDLENQLFQSMTEALDLTKAGALDQLETFYIMREYFAGNFIAPAGVLSHRFATNDKEAESTTKPGEKGGLVADGAAKSAFTSESTDKMIASGSLWNPNDPVIIVPELFQTEEAG